jgi:hypothetical protein
MSAFRVARQVWTALLAGGGVVVSIAALQAGAPDRNDAPGVEGVVASAVAGIRIDAGRPLAPRPLVTATESDTLLLLPRLTMPIVSARMDAPSAVSAARATPAPRHESRQEAAFSGTDTKAAPTAPGAAVPAHARTVAKEHPHAADDARSGFSPYRIAHIRRALRLRPDQEAYWQSVEAVLREIGRQQAAAGHGLPVSKAATSAAPIDPDKLQQLTSAAIPLIMSLDEAQKSEARALARSMGLENVASAI